MKKAVSSLLAIGGLSLAASSHAVVITDSFSNSLQTTEISQSGTLDKFDGSLGTLNSVTLTLSGNSVSSTMLENTASGSQFFEFDSLLNFFFDTSSVGVTPPAPAFSTTLATTGGFVSLASGATLDLGTTTDSGSYSATLTGADLASFIGGAGDTFNVGCNTITGSTFTGGGGNINNTQSTEAACGAEIAYDYTATTPPNPVPEPTALWLLGAGLLGLTGIRRKKAK